MGLTRRQFLGSSVSAVIVAGTMARGKVFGANERVRVGVVGINGRGGSHIDGFIKAEGSEVAALCDCDKKVLDSRVQSVQDVTQKAPKAYVDMREMFDDKDIDAISFATPNHWHALGTVWACQAGKDVYVEKPVSHDLWEGRKVVEAAAKYKRIVQHGTQARSEVGWIRAIERIQEGVIGEIYMARALCYKNRNSIGEAPFEDPPAHLDWNLWQGPAQERKFCKNYVPYNWHWFWAYGNGDIGNQGVHQMDIATWGMPNGLPVKIHSTGGRYTYHDQGETPNTQVATFTYGDGKMLVFEVRGRSTNDESGLKVGNLFYGSEGYMAGQHFYDKKGNEIKDEKAEQKESWGTGNCWQNFVNSVRSRKQDHPHGNATQAHIGCAHVHMANISYRLGTSLEFDPKKEQCVGNSKANDMLKRNYRKEFAIPEKV
jgi:predicted dehydrogenase